MKTIKTALVAYGMSGRVFHAPFITAHPGFELVGAWERANKKIQTDYPEAKSYESLDALLADAVQLVVINTPIDTHFDYAKKALEAGKHVLVEKAFTATAAQAETLRDLAKSKALSLTVYQNRRWDSDFLTVHSVLRQNVLGNIVEAEIRFDRYRPELSDKVWKESSGAGTGILMDLGSHIIDQALCLFGMPDSLFADIRKVRENSVIDDNFDILLYYKDKRVRLHSGMFNREALPAYVLQGTKGSFVKYRGDVQEDVLKTGAKPGNDWGKEPDELQGILHTETGRVKLPTLNGNYMCIYDGVYGSIVDGKPEIVSAADGFNAMRIIEAARLSHSEKRVVNL